METTDGEVSTEEYARRSGDRRREQNPVAEERRQGDRRKRKPGLSGLVRAILGKD